jgi:AraC-like DNA-binding protein/ketosteroid isomerase-like protein
MQATELVRNYFSAWNRRDPAGIVSLLARNGFYFDIPTNKKLSGEALVRYLAHDFTQRKLHYDLVGEILIGNSMIAFQYQTYNVDDPADSAVRLHGAEFLTVRGDKVTSIEDYYKFPLDTGSQVKPDVSEAANPEIKYRKSGLQKEQAEVYQKRLLVLMESERLYIDADLTLPKLAHRMNCSVNHVSQVINGGFKQSFHNFLNQYRIEAAKELLTRGPSSRQSIGEVARCVGFTSSSAFYVAFRQLCRQTPSEFRRLHRKN